jgi:MFS family permease
MGLSLGLLGGLTSYGALMSVMLAYGVGFGLLFPAAAAQVVSVTSEEDRGRAFGLYYAAFSLGIVAGPVVSSLLHVWTGLSPFLCGAAALLAGVPLVAAAYARLPAGESKAGASR